MPLPQGEDAGPGGGLVQRVFLTTEADCSSVMCLDVSYVSPDHHTGAVSYPRVSVSAQVSPEKGGALRVRVLSVPSGPFIDHSEEISLWALAGFWYPPTPFCLQMPFPRFDQVL